MEMHQLRYVVAVARAGNFSRAAERCHVAQPSLSQQILKLEEELGERLFERLKREVRLTAHGQAFLPRAVRILEEVDAAMREAGDAKNLLRGKLTVGVLPTIAPYLLPRTLVDFSASFPGVEMVVHEDTTTQLLKQVLDYEIEMAIASLPIADDRLIVRHLFTEELKLALPPGHRLARKRSILLEDLRKEQFIVMRSGHCLGDQVLRFCDRRDFKPRISFRGAQLETIQALVSAGAGISLIPEMAVRPGLEGAPMYRALSAPKPERRIVACWPKQRSPSRAAIEFLKSISPRSTRRN